MTFTRGATEYGALRWRFQGACREGRSLLTGAETLMTKHFPALFIFLFILHGVTGGSLVMAILLLHLGGSHLVC